MKKAISVLIICAIVTGSVFVTATAQTSCNCGTAPLIVVSGFATVPLTLDADTENAKTVWSPSGDSILSGVSKLISPLIKLGFTKDWDSFMDVANPEILNIFMPVLCDKDGNSVNNVTVRKFPLSADNYPDFYNGDDVDEQAFVKSAVEKLGGDHVWFFSYDWRLDPVEHAKELREYVKNVKKETGHSRVSLAGCSMGGTVIMSYLRLFGSGDIQNFVLDNAAFQGTQLVGELLKLDIEIDGKSAANYANQFIKSKLLDWIIEKSNIFGELVPHLEKIIDSTRGKLSRDVLFPVFANMPGMWSLVADDVYESAKKAALDSSVNAKLIKKIDFYHYQVQRRAKELIHSAVLSGCNVIIIANYNFYGVPITPSRYNNNDILIDTKYASGGATCADLGSTFDEDYVQKVNCGHNHVSPDNVIDASTCILPENTWFVKNMKHLDFPYGSEAADFLMWAVSAKRGEHPNVFSKSSYPQFMEYSYSTKKLTPISENAETVLFQVVNPQTGD